ncbi:hypothetical protein MMC11_003608 [Xylographa trunciseda]|nr:hypothetical protein [Xylographa trunciseda]
MAFLINSITAKSDYLVTTSAGAIIFPVAVTVWSLASPQTESWYADGSGSKQPTIFRILPSPTDQYIVAVQLEGLFTFPSSWTGQYQIQAYLKGISTAILASEPQTVPPPTNPPIPFPIKIGSFNVPAPFKDDVCPVPFCWTGDFEWKISNVNVEGNIVSSVLPVRLEFCWARSEATSGPLFVHSEFVDTRVDFGSTYPIGLVRQFWPRPSEFQDVPNFRSIEVYTAWYVQRAIKSIWDWGTPHEPDRPRYDCKGGAASYNVNGLGGSFDLQRWFAPCSPSGTCNGYDLAAISQLACAMLLNDEGNEFVRSKWVLQSPVGYVLPGTLYGREAVPDCNNPFFEARGSPAFVNPQLNPLDFEVNRSAFDSHTWVEVLFPTADSRSVIDATQCTGATIENGTKTRDVYSAACIDSTWNLPSLSTATMFGNLENNGVTAPSGTCYQTPEYRLCVTDQPRIDRIGVHGIKAADPMPFFSIDFSLPSRMRNLIEAALDLGLNPNPPPPSYYDASLDQASLSTVFASSNKIQHLQTFCSISRFRSKISHDFSTDGGAGFTVEVFTHVNFEDPIKSMIHYLASFEASLSDVVSATPSLLGLRSLQSLSSIFWIRGNLFILLNFAIPDDLLLSGREDDFAQYKSQSFDLALKLDGYLAQHAVDQSLISKPDTTLVKGADMPDQVKVDTIFSITMANPQTAATTSYCESDDPSVLVADGVVSEGGTFNFYGRRTGLTVLTLFLAQRNTFYPIARDFVVEVTD